MPGSLGPVLIVEGEVAVRDSLRFSPEMEGLRVLAYRDVASIIDEKDLPVRGCLVMSCLPSILNGVDHLGTLRARDIRLPAILIATDAWSDAMNRLAPCGAWFVQGEPVDGDALMSTISRRSRRRSDRPLEWLAFSGTEASFRSIDVPDARHMRLCEGLRTSPW